MKYITFIVTSYICLIIITLGMPCNRGYFSVNGTKCHPLITCHEINELELGELVGFGAVKKIYKSLWKGFDIAVVAVNNPEFLIDFHHELDLLIKLSPNKFVATLVGYCKSSNVYVKEYYPYGNALYFEKFLPPEVKFNIKARLSLCLNYVNIIEFFHSAFDTPAVMCDTNTLNKTLEQYLLTGSSSLVANDIDSLTEVGTNGILCGHKELRGDFIAPEQRWPYPADDYDESLMPKYDEKTDIWKVPSVCKHFLGKNREAKIINYHLYSINKRCQNRSSKRPNSTEILRAYQDTFNYFFQQKNGLDNKGQMRSSDKEQLISGPSKEQVKKGHEKEPLKKESNKEQLKKGPDKELLKIWPNKQEL